MFRVLLAEIVAESICRKALTLQAKARPWEFHFIDLAEPQAIIDDVFGHIHQRLRDLVADAHAVMLTDRDLRNTQDKEKEPVCARSAITIEETVDGRNIFGAAATSQS